ncbi:MAG: sulfite exporter TauE/SafE family protein [Neorhizobium sp.]|nr:sulfite exporter TauE/SafE family protein [Neorhizobium sp.]
MAPDASPFDVLAAWLSGYSGYSAGQIGFVTVAALIAGLARGFSGFGGALIFIPLAGSAVGPKAASALLLVVDGVMTLGMLPDGFRRANRREVLTMLCGAFFGVPAGTALLALIAPVTLRWIISIVVLGLLAFLISGWRYHGKPKTYLTVGVGALAGLFGGAAQMSGPPIVAYWLGGAIAPLSVRANLVLYFALSTVLSAISYLAGGILTVAVLKIAVIVGPAYGIGLYFGSRLFGVASDTTFRRLCFTLIGMAALLGLPLFDAVLP